MTTKTNIADLAHDVHRDNHHLGVGKGDTETLVRSVFDQILARVAAGEIVEVRGFGVFQSKVFPGRTLSSPLMKGGSVAFADQMVLRFRQSQQAKKTINALHDELQAKKGKKGKKAGKAQEATEETPEAEATPAPKAKKARDNGKPEAPKKGKKAKPAPEPEPEAEETPKAKKRKRAAEAEA